MQGAVPQITPHCKWKQPGTNSSMTLFTSSPELAAGVSAGAEDHCGTTTFAVDRHT